MSPTTNTIHPIASENHCPLSRSESSDWVLVTHTSTATPTSTSTTSSLVRATDTSPTVTPRRNIHRPSTSSALRARSPTALRRSERRHNLQAIGNRDLPAEIRGSRVTELPASAIEVYSGGSRPPQPSPSTPTFRTISRNGRSRRTGNPFADDNLSTSTRRQNNNVRNSIMISFTPPYKSQGFLELYPAAYTAHAGSSKSLMSTDETAYPTIATKGPLYVKAKVMLDNGINGIEMVGGPRTGTGYSLAGHVVLTVPNLSSSHPPLNDICNTHVRQIKRLRVAFEGKSEFHDDAGRYHATQLCRVEKDLISDSTYPQILQHAEATTTTSVFDDSTTYAIAFDLNIPGWLPASISNDLTTTSYGVLCNAEVGWVLQSGSEGLSPLDVNMDTCTDNTSISSLPIPIGTGLTAASRFLPRLAKSMATVLTGSPVAQWDPSHNRTFQSEWQPVDIMRHRASPTTFNSRDGDGNSVTQTVNHSDIPLRHFTLKPSEDSPSPIECMVSTPEIVDLNGPNLRVSVRLRARKPVSSSRSQPPPEASQAIPAGFMRSTDENGDVDMDDEAGIPGSNMPGSIGEVSSQRVPTSIVVENRVKMVELGMEVEEIERYSSEPTQSFTASFPVPETQPDLSAGNKPFDTRHTFLSPPSSHARMSLLGLSTQTPGKVNRSRALLLGEDGRARTYRFEGDGLDLGNGWRKVNIVIPLPGRDMENNGALIPQAELETPHLRVKHKLKIKLIYKSANSVDAETVVCLTTPLRMSTSTSVLRRSSLSAGSDPTQTAPLPPYNQIFHENGAVREDEDPLPLYEPPLSNVALANGDDISPALRDLPTDSREAMDIEDREEVLRTVISDDTLQTSTTFPWPSPVSAQTANWPASPSSIPSLVHTPLSSQLNSPFSSFESVPEPRTPRSLSPASFEDATGLAFSAASPDFVGVQFGLPGSDQSDARQSRIHEATSGHPMVTRAKVAGSLARLHELS